MPFDMDEVRKIAVENAGMGYHAVILAKAILLIEERLRAVEQWQQAEDNRTREASEYE